MFQEMMALGSGGGSGDLGTLEPLIPSMTSRTAPSGSVTSSSIYSSSYDDFRAFAAFITVAGWLPSSEGNGWIQYDFPSGTSKIAKTCVIGATSMSNDLTCTISGYDGSNWKVLKSELPVKMSKFNNFILDNTTAYNSYKFEFGGLSTSGQGVHIQIFGE